MNRIDLIRLRPGTQAERLIQTLRQALPSPAQALLRPTLPGVYNGGDLLLRQRGVATPGVPLRQDAIDHVDSVIYEDGEGGGEWNGTGIYRALLLAVKPAIAEATVERFERELLAMPRYIASIRAWRLSRVTQARGARAWTHVWEQRYDDLDGLNVDYMLHPYHWAHVDRWFDPEHPDWIVDTHLCHSFCALD